jgi:ATP-dependent Clp protease protease subunit
MSSNSDSPGVYYDTEKRKISLAGDFDERNTKEIIWALQEMEAIEKRDPIDIYITSNGGEAECFLSIYDVIQNLKCKVNTIALGKAYSAGAYLLLSGTGDRIAYKNTFIMLHELSSSTEGRLTDMRITQGFYDRLQKTLNKIVSEHTGQPLSKVEEDLKRDMWMNAEEAKKYGIIDKII